MKGGLNYERGLLAYKNYLGASGNGGIYIDGLTNWTREESATPVDILTPTSR